MFKVRNAVTFLFVLLLFSACSSELHCERHYFVRGFTGRVTIYYNQEKGFKETDERGCNVFRISEEGESFSGFLFKQGTATPHDTFRYFETLSKDSLLEIKEFFKSEYLSDSSGQKEDRKYVFFISSGFHNPDGKSPTYTRDYVVDYGRNFRNYEP